MTGTIQLQRTFRALRNRNFLIYWAGQGISVSGTWMQSMALSWLLYRITNSPLSLGFLAAARFGPSLVGSPFAGVVADHFHRRTVVIVTQATSLLLAVGLSILTLTGSIHVWHILTISLIQGCVDMLDMTARQTFQRDIVEAEDLQSAVALNSAVFNAGRLVGPVLAGIVLHLKQDGESWCFLINAISYLAVLISLFLLKSRPQTSIAMPSSVLKNIGEGLHYAWHAAPVRERLIAIGITTSVGLSVFSIMPVFARDILHAGARGYSLLLAAGGVGSILGALVAAGSQRLARIHPYSLMILGLGLAAIGFTRNLAFALLWMTIVGIAVSLQMTRTNAFLQNAAPGHLRGRVMSIYVWVFTGFTPLGGLLAGWTAQHAGAAVTALSGGTLCFVAGLIFLLPRQAPASTNWTP
jgi:MFS family permease